MTSSPGTRADLMILYVSLAVSLIVDTTKAPSTPKIQEALTHDQWQKAKAVAEQGDIPELPVKVEKLFEETVKVCLISYMICTIMALTSILKLLNSESHGKHAALKYLMETAALDQQDVEDSPSLQAIDILMYM